MNAEVEPTECPKCGWPVGTDESLCRECGTEVHVGATVEDEGGTPDLGRQADTDEALQARLADALGNVQAAGEQGVEESISQHSSPAAQPASPAIPGAEPGGTEEHSLRQHGHSRSQPPLECGDCEELRVEYNQARVFLTGFTSAFNFRITPLSADTDTLSDIRVRVESPGFLAKPLLHRSLLRHIRAGRALPEVHLNLEPERSGQDLAGEVYVSFKKAGKRRAFYGSFLWDVYPPSEPSAKVIENLSVKIGDIVSTGDRAGDAKTTVSFLDDVQRSGRYSRAEELRQIKLPSAWNRLALYECDARLPCRPEIDDPPIPAYEQRLTIETRTGHMVHLIHTDTALQIGKNRSCDIVTWFMELDGSKRIEDRTGCVSRNHCRIVKEGDGWFVADGNGHSPSSHGTFLDGVQVSLRQSKAIAMDVPFTLSLAGRKTGDPKVFRFIGRLWSCAALGRCQKCQPHEPACLVLKRTDGIPETFVVLWRFCPVEAIDEGMKHDFGSGRLFRHKNAYAFSCGTDEKTYAWMVPGMNVDEAGVGIKVGPYQQFGKWTDGTEQT